MASVFYIESQDAVVTLNNVTLTNNEGDAIYNAGTLNMSGVIMTAAATVDNANSINNAGTIKVSGTGNKFYSGIYNAGY